jgi:DNA-binding LacI/PurR family transcriptional regulator
MKERLAGYERALDEAGFSVEPELIKIVPGTSVEYHKLLRAETYNFTQKLLNSKVDAVLCGNSLAAIGVVNCLEEHNVKIGSDVKLITFDDDIWLSLTNPRISAVAQPSRDIGALAAKQLLKRIKSRGSERAILRLGAKLILRESC